MRQPPKIFLCLFLVFFIFTSKLFGVEIFGPEKFIRSDGNPDVYSRTFETTAGPGKLMVRNGENDGEKRVPYSITSARVFLNDTEIFGPDDFNQTVFYLEADINLNQSNSLRVELGSQPGDFLTMSIEQEILSPLSISITSPGNNNSIGRSDTMVKGTLNNPFGNEVGVTVNGILALVDGTAFTANHVPLDADESIISAVATDSEGNTGSASITVNLSPAVHYIHLRVDQESGISPFATTLKVDGSFNFTAQPPACIGPGPVGIVNGAQENDYNVTLTTPGTYYFTSTVEFEGAIYSDTVAIYVMDKTQLDNLLKLKWNAMKQALICGNIEGAMAYYQKAVHEKYNAIYTALGSELTTLIQQMNDISPIVFYDVLAKYRIRQDHDINGQMITITYYIYFSKDEKGLWRIENY
jgi:hypothetical protein